MIASWSALKFPEKFNTRVRAFASDDSGAMVILALFFFVIMLAAAGLGVDTMRHEMQRTHIQATLDSAVLAGAGAPAGATEEDIKDIVEDYFDAAGLQEYLHEIDPDKDIDAGINSKRVTASASMTMNTLLMKLSGVKTLNAGGVSTAAIASPKMEIVLALDVSGSMAGTRLTKLKEAAKEFVSDVLNKSDEGSTTISIVPYSWNVTPTQEIFDALSVDQQHGYSTCLDFADDEFNSSSIDPNRAYAQTIFTSVYGNFGEVGNGNVEYGSSSAYNRSCFTDDYFRILPYASTYAPLEAKIDSLKAAGSTSSDMGMKWASALIDPAFRPVVTELQKDRAGTDSDGNAITYNIVNPDINDLPALYTTGQVRKIIILMGDGANDWSYHLNDPNDLIDPDVPKHHTWDDYRGPNSNLYFVKYNEKEFERAKLVDRYGRVLEYSNRESKCGTDEYERSGWWGGQTYVGTWECDYTRGSEELTGYYIYTPRKSQDYYEPEHNNYYSDLDDLYPYILEGETVDLPLPGGRTCTLEATGCQLKWEEAWGLMSPDYYRQKSGDSTPDDQFARYSSGSISPSDKDDRMSSICAATKAKDNVLIFTIAFEMGDQSSAAGKLRSCASEEGYHYDANTVNIKQAFGSIAANVQKLRLTQ